MVEDCIEESEGEVEVPEDEVAEHVVTLQQVYSALHILNILFL